MYMVFLPVCVYARHVYASSGGQKRVSNPRFGVTCVCATGNQTRVPQLLLLSRLSTLARLFGTIGTLKLMEEHRCLKYLLVVITGLCHHALLCVSGQNQLLEGTLTSPLGLGGTHHIIMFPGQDAPMGTEAQQLWCRAEGDGHRTRAV